MDLHWKSHALLMECKLCCGNRGAQAALGQECSVTCSRRWAEPRLVSSLQQAGLSRRLFLLYLRSKSARDTHTPSKSSPPATGRQVWHSVAVDALAGRVLLATHPDPQC